MNNLPASSNLARKRVLKTTAGMYSRKKRRNSRSMKEKSATDRKLQFPNAPLKVRGCDLVCTVCDATLALKYSTIKRHLASKFHKSKVELRSNNRKTLEGYASSIKESDAIKSMAGCTLPLEVLAYRMKVTYAILKSGLPFNILDSGSEVRELFEDGHCPINKDSCASFIPILNELEQKRTIEELKTAQGYSLCSDETMNVRESFAMVSITICDD